MMTDRLMYPRPRNEDFEVHEILHELQEDEALFREFLVDPDAVMSRFQLDDEARVLIRTHDYEGMVRRGIHPIMVVQLQRQVEWGIKMFSAEDAGSSER